MRRDARSNAELTAKNKEVSKTIRRDIRNNCNRKTQKTIERNKIMKVLRQHLSEGKTDTIKIKKK